MSVIIRYSSVVQKFFLPLLLGLLPRLLSAAPYDTAKTGVSGIGTVVIGANGSLQWRAIRPDSGSIQELGTFGAVGGDLVPGSWGGPQSFDLGIVDYSNNSVRWRLQGALGSSVAKEFFMGNGPQVALGGVDFDGNTVLDAATVARNGSQMVWRVKLNPALSDVQELSFVFGSRTCRPFFFSPTGGVDHAACLARSGRKGLIIHRTLEGSLRQRLVPPRQKSFPLVVPLPIKDSEGRDNLLFIESKALGRTRLSYFRLARRRWEARTVAYSGTPLIGDFLPSPGEEVALVNPGAPTFYFNPLTRVSSTSVSVEGIPVDEININNVGADKPVPGNPTVSPSPIDPSLPLPGVCQARDPRDGGGGFVWKPNSDTQFFAAIVLPPALSAYVTKVEILSTAGVLLSTPVGKGIGNGGRTAWQDRSRTGANYAREYGAVLVKVYLNQGGCITYAINDPSKRVD
jgi:hypothetical protein